MLAGFAAFDQTGLTPVEREVVAMTVAFEQGCEYCMALHSAQLTSEAELAPLLAALRAGSPLPNARLEAVRSFVKAIWSKRGQLSPETQRRFLTAGFQPPAALEVLLARACTSRAPSSTSSRVPSSTHPCKRWLGKAARVTKTAGAP